LNGRVSHRPPNRSAATRDQFAVPIAPVHRPPDNSTLILDPYPPFAFEFSISSRLTCLCVAKISVLGPCYDVINEENNRNNVAELWHLIGQSTYPPFCSLLAAVVVFASAWWFPVPHSRWLPVDYTSICACMRAVTLNPATVRGVATSDGHRVLR